MTYVPDDNFEQVLINLGYDNILDDSVLTANINSIQTLDVNNQNIADLTGIEDFTALTNLDCNYNQLTSFDISQNTALANLHCTNNQLTSLDVSTNIALAHLECQSNQLTSLDINQNTALTYLSSSWNQLTSLDVIQNTDLTYLYCGWNQLTNLDVSQNTNLTDLRCNDNQLTSLDIRNGNNTNMESIQAGNNVNLTCISVDDFQFSISNWTNPFWFGFDSQDYFSNNCGALAIEELTINKELHKIIDILGRETSNKGFQLHIYDDGTVDKKYLIK